MKTNTEFEPVTDDASDKVEEVLEVSSSKVTSLVDQLRATFSKPGKYVLNCQEMTEEKWDDMYPPQVKELASLRGRGFPHWHYEWNYCTHCHSMLSSCKNNPYGHYGAIGRARLLASLQNYERAKAAAAVASSPKQITTEVVDEVTGEVTTVITTEASKVRATHGTYKQMVSPDSQKTVRDMYLAGGSINSISAELLIAAKAVRDFLAQERILRKQGEHLKTLAAAKPKSVAVIKPVSNDPPAPRGKPRTTFVITDAIVATVSKMLANGEGGGMVAIAKAQNLNASELSKALKATGVVITQGRKDFGAVQSPRGVVAAGTVSHMPQRMGRARTTNLITPEIVAKVTKMMAKNQGGGLVKIAQSLNVNASELSIALKTAGVAFKGARKTAVDDRLTALASKY